MLVLQTRKLNLRVIQLLSGFNLGNVVFESEPLATTLSSLCPEVEGKPCWKLKEAPENLKLSAAWQHSSFY